MPISFVVITFDLCGLYYTVMSPVYLNFPLPLKNTSKGWCPVYFVQMANPLSYEEYVWEGEWDSMGLHYCRRVGYILTINVPVL
jgi:hypothetical protein